MDPMMFIWMGGVISLAGPRRHNPGGTLGTQGLLGPIFLGPSDDLPGSILGPFQDLRATFGHLLVAPAWPIQAFSGTFR